MKIEDITECSVCHDRNLISDKLYIEDFYGELSLKDIKTCKECDTIHYIRNGVLLYEFSLKINKSNVIHE